MKNLDIIASTPINSTRNLIISSTSFIFLCTLLFCYSAFLPSRTYPMVPVILDFDQILTPLQPVLFSTFLIGLICSVFYQNRLVVSISLIVFIFMCLADYNRIQPYFYQYCIVILFFLLEKEKEAIYSMKLFFVATYLFSGINKINPHFESQVLTFILKPYHPFIPYHQYVLKALAIIIPFIEITAALSIFTKFNKIGFSILIALHFIILILFIPIFNRQYNLTILPWNIGMILWLYILKKDNQPVSVKYKKVKFYLLSFLFFILPFTSLWGAWDRYLSFNLYSGKLLYAKIVFPINESSSNISQKYIKAIPNNGVKSVELFKWCHDELGLLPYPEQRVYKTTFKRLQQNGSIPLKSKLIYLQP